MKSFIFFIFNFVFDHLVAMNTQGQGQGQQQQVIDESVLDDIIRRLTEVRLARPGKQVQLSEAEIKQLCVASRDIFLQQPNLLELEAPIKICGILLVLLLSKFHPLIALFIYLFIFL